MRKTMMSVVAGLLLTASVYAQAPEKMSYQAVIRNSSNGLVESKKVGMQISILQTTAEGTAVYVETQTPTTNTNGLVSLEIGTGTVVSGTFSSIDWASGIYFIKTETDPTGGTTYTITGTSQLMSVPYALHAKTASNGVTTAQTTILGNTSGTNTGDQTISRTGATVTLTNGGTFTDSVNTYTAGTNITISASNVISASGSSTDKFYLGQDTLGGIVYFIYKDATGTQHGLIVNKAETSVEWQAAADTVITNANHTEDGKFNTNLMSNSPAATYVTSLGDGLWYLPSIDELGELWRSRLTINKTLRSGGFTLLSSEPYWSSNEDMKTEAFVFTFNTGAVFSKEKTDVESVRAIRSF